MGENDQNRPHKDAPMMFTITWPSHAQEPWTFEEAIAAQRLDLQKKLACCSKELVTGEARHLACPNKKKYGMPWTMQQCSERHWLVWNRSLLCCLLSN